MKKTLLTIISIFIVQSAMAQKVDWNKPLYKVSVIEDWYKMFDYKDKHNLTFEELESLPINFYVIQDTIATYTYSGDTMIYRTIETFLKNKKTYIKDELVREDNTDISNIHNILLDSTTTYKKQGDTTIVKKYYKRVLVEEKYLDGKIIEEWYCGSHYSYGYNYTIYQYDSLGSLSTKMHLSYRQNKIAHEFTDTIYYTNTYDKKNRLVGIVGTDNKNITIKYGKHKKIEISHTPKDKYRKVFYYKDPDYKNDSLILTHTWRGYKYIRTQYDSLNRPTLIDYWSDYDYIGPTYTTYKYIDNIKYCDVFDIDTSWIDGIIYKKEEE